MDDLSNLVGDPSLEFELKENGEIKTYFYNVFYVTELNLEFRNSENQESLDRVVRLRILVCTDDTIMKQIKIEILDDSDLYFFVEAVFNEEQFNKMKKEDQLLIDFESFPEEIKNFFNECQSTDAETQIAYIEENDGSGILEFSQFIELKSVEVLIIHFVLSDPEFIQRQVQFRFNQMSNLLARNNAILEEFNHQMQTKNPILLKSLHSTKSPKRGKK